MSNESQRRGQRQQRPADKADKPKPMIGDSALVAMIIDIDDLGLGPSLPTRRLLLLLLLLISALQAFFYIFDLSVRATFSVSLSSESQIYIFKSVYKQTDR